MFLRFDLRRRFYGDNFNLAIVTMKRTKERIQPVPLRVREGARYKEFPELNLYHAV